MTVATVPAMSETTTTNGHTETKADVKMRRAGLWDNYDTTTVDETEALVGAAEKTKSRSDAIRALVEEYGKNAFVREGEDIVFAKRKGKDEYYVKNSASAEVVDL